MQDFIRSSLESLLRRFETVADAYPELRHAMIVGTNEKSGMGGEVAGHDWSNPQFKAYKMLGKGLAREGQRRWDVLSHDLVTM